jgi:hypothetical protein
MCQGIKTINIKNSFFVTVQIGAGVHPAGCLEITKTERKTKASVNWRRPEVT